MTWNWQLPDWPHFKFDPTLLASHEKEFLIISGSGMASLKNISEEDQKQFIVEILSTEGEKSSKIEGEILDRESLQSSIRKHFGLKAANNKDDKETAMGEVLCNLYETFDQPLTHEMLWHWHFTLFSKNTNLSDLGTYRTHLEPMQIVSNRYTQPLLFFEAPPSSCVPEEMEAYVNWFNGLDTASYTLSHAAIVHLYFESIHPFEDGNGRIGRLLVEKILSKSIGRPLLIAISKILEKKKKEYYEALERCNRTLEVQHFVEFFAKCVLEGQQDSLKQLHFLLRKTKLMSMLSGQLNERQEKVLLKLFSMGPSGFQGGLSAEKYIAMTKASRATATRDLADLVDKGALSKQGELKHTRYFLKIS